MVFQYKKVLLIGATSGIGEALATRFVENNIPIIITGRRKEKLDSFVQKHKDANVTPAVFDMTKVDQIANFVSDITSSHPDLDCILINAGIQRGFDFAHNASKIDLSPDGDFATELTTNYVAPVHLTAAFLPHLQRLGESNNTPTALMYTSSQLALLPMVRAPNYGATKAALHHFILALREQLKNESSADGGSNGSGKVSVVEIFPPSVQTELHDTKHQPDLQNGGQIGMPLDEFTDALWEGLVQGNEQIAVGASKDAFDAFEWERQEAFGDLQKEMAEKMKKHQRG